MCGYFISPQPPPRPPPLQCAIVFQLLHVNIVPVVLGAEAHEAAALNGGTAAAAAGHGTVGPPH